MLSTATDKSDPAAERGLAERGWRYSLVGLACATLNYLIILTIDALGGHYLIAMVVAFAMVTPIGFILHSKLTFGQPLRWRAFLRFTAGVASAAPAAFIAMIILCSGLDLHVAIATPIATVVVFLWNFAAAHWAIVPRFDLRSAFGSVVSKRTSRRPTGSED